ncbi:MAG: class II fructose-bisphosphate aldolase [Thermodesulfobacteriota bacterium]
MGFESTGEMYDSLKGAVKEGGEVIDEAALRGEAIDAMVRGAVFGGEEVSGEARSLIKAAAGSLGIFPASIQGLYEAMGSGEVSGFTVPAINIRGLTYDTARAVFRAAMSNDSGAFIFEIAKSEIGYTGQSPAEYSAAILAAAVKEGFRGPVFIQGDHFQINAKNSAEDGDKEVGAIKALVKEAIEADFLNIDIDASTVVDLSKPTVKDQQEPNFTITAALTAFIRENEPDGVTVSVGGEIGEVGGKNSTEDELRAFMDGFLDTLDKKLKGISKISIQTGTSHGGVVMPDGSIAKVSVDFDIIEKLSKVSREAYGLAGVVQHGASTLPDDAFHLFVEKSAAEVHLATGFQNMVYDSPAFPVELRDEVYNYLKDNFPDEMKEGQTEEQFIYKTRKKGFGPFKEKFWNLDAARKDIISGELEERFDQLFKKLNCGNTVGHVRKWVG